MKPISDADAKLLDTLRFLCEERDISAASIEDDVLSEEAIVVDDKFAWRLDILLHELSHYAIAANGFMHIEPKREKSFYSFEGNGNEIQTVAVAIAAQRLLVKRGLWSRDVLTLEQSITQCGLTRSYKNTGAPLKIAQLTLDHDPTIARFATAIVNMIEIEWTKPTNN